MFHTCARIIEQLDDNTSKDGVVVLLARQKRTKLRQTADDFVRAECGGASLTGAQRRLLDKLIAALHTSIHEPE